MKTQRWMPWAMLLGAALLAGACSRNDVVVRKEPTETQRKQAAHMVSEAQFALSIRDYPRAEKLYTEAAEIMSGNGVLWVNVGQARIRQGNRNGAKEAYQRALRTHEADARADKTNPDPLLQQVYVLALLGRADQARALLTKTAQDFPESRSVRQFVEAKQLEQLLADPKFKEVAL